MQMAAIYTRVSSSQQREAHTIASQTAALVDWAATIGLEVPRVFGYRVGTRKSTKMCAGAKAVCRYMKYGAQEG